VLKVSPHSLHLNFFSVKIPSTVAFLILKSSGFYHLFSVSGDFPDLKHAVMEESLYDAALGVVMD